MAHSHASDSFLASVTDGMRTRVHDSVIRNRLRLDEYGSLLLSHNEKVNLISRRSVDDVFDRHIRHSLSLVAKRFAPRSVLVDWGTGGGLPAIPLAIVTPDAAVTAVDATAKKIRAVSSMAEQLNLRNLQTWTGRAEEYAGTADYSVSRATAPLKTLWEWHTRVENASERTYGPDIWQPGLLCLKGGDLAAELADLKRAAPDVNVAIYDVAQLQRRPYFEEKALIHVYR